MHPIPYTALSSNLFHESALLRFYTNFRENKKWCLWRQSDDTRWCSILFSSSCEWLSWLYSWTRGWLRAKTEQSSRKSPPRPLRTKRKKKQMRREGFYVGIITVVEHPALLRISVLRAYTFKPHINSDPYISSVVMPFNSTRPTNLLPITITYKWYIIQIII